MAFGPSARDSRTFEAMPPSYTAILLLWSLPFVVVVLVLVSFYVGVLVLSVRGFFAEMTSPSSNNGPLFFSIVGIITGAYLLAIIAKALTTVHVPQGVRLQAGVFPQLESLIRDCTLEAGIEPPDDVFIVPDANAFAYSSGRFSLHERLNHYVLIGAPLLVHLEPTDLAAVLFHEFGHLLMRRGLWAVSLHHKVEDFLTRCSRAQLHRQGCALIFTIVPGMMVVFFLRVFRWSLAGFSKREELLVDSLAARLMGEWQFRERLVRSITTIGALQARLDGERSLVEQINTEFHRRLMAAAPVDSDGGATPNYFEVARSVPVQSAFRWDDRLASVYDGLIRKQSGPADSHPSLSERIRNLHGVIAPEVPFYSSSTVHLFKVPAGAETTVSSAFASELRATFFKEKLASGLGPLDGIRPESVVEFRCRHGACPREGQVELAMTQDELLLSSGDEQYRLRWHEVGRVEVYTGSNFNFFMTAARVLGAALREAPSDRVLRLHMTNGGMIEFPHWHVMDDIQEVEALVRELWGLPRVFGTVTDDSGTPVPGAVVRLRDEQGVVWATRATGEDGSYSLAVRSNGRMMICVRATGFLEAFAPHDVGHQRRSAVQVVLHPAQSPDPTVVTLPAVRRPQPALTAELRSPKRGNARAAGCLALSLKLVCGVVAYFVPFLIAMMLTLPTKDYQAFGRWTTACTVFGFCTAAIGWQLGNRLALKYLFTIGSRGNQR